MKAVLGLCAAVVGMAMVFPLAPWVDVFRGGPISGGPSWGTLGVLMGMTLGAWLLGRPKAEARWPASAALALALGLTFLIEPLIHNAILEWNAWRPSAGGVRLVFPYGVSEESLQSLVAQVLMLVLIPALVEEWFFRGCLLPWIAAKIGPWQALSITTLGFAVIHGTMLQVLIALPLGFIWGLVRLRTGRLYPCIAAHALHNALVLILGPSLLSIAVLPLLLGLSGVYLLVVAWRHGWQPAPGRRAAGLALALGWLAVIGGIVPLAAWHRAAWVSAAVTIMDDSKVPAHVLIPRLQHMAQRGVPPPAWLDDAAAELSRRHQPVTTDRQVLLISQLTGSFAPHRLGFDPDSGHYLHLRVLAEHAGETEALAAARKSLCLEDPMAVVDLTLENPGLLPVWFPDEPAQDLILMTMAQRLGDQHRRRLNRLVQMTQGDDRALRLLLATPPERIGPRDRRHLIMHFPKWQAALEGLAQTNPRAAAAWRFTPLRR